MFRLKPQDRKAWYHSSPALFEWLSVSKGTVETEKQKNISWKMVHRLTSCRQFIFMPHYTVWEQACTFQREHTHPWSLVTQQGRHQGCETIGTISISAIILSSPFLPQIAKRFLYLIAYHLFLPACCHFHPWLFRQEHQVNIPSSKWRGGKLHSPQGCSASSKPHTLL